MATQPLPIFTFEEYLDFEELTDERHEYYRGIIYARPGGTDIHSDLICRLIYVISGRLPQHCKVNDTSLKIYIGPDERCVYPDVSITCGRRQYWSDRRDIVTNPTAVAEVLSPSTKRYDRGAKLTAYQMLPSVRDCLLVAQERIEVEHHWRAEGDQGWESRTYERPEERVSFAGVDLSLTLAEIYQEIL